MYHAGTGTVFAEAQRCQRTNRRRDAKTVPVPAARLQQRCRGRTVFQRRLHRPSITALITPLQSSTE
jgi:hypothetical protein